MSEIVKLYQKTKNGIVEQVIQTTAEAVTVNGPDIGLADSVKNVKSALQSIKTIADSSGVTGVRGANETVYHKGDVTLSAANIGAVASNTPITGGTFTRVTVDSKGLVTKGARATLDEIDDGSTRKLADYIPLTQKGAKNGVAELDANGLVPASQLPGYVDDVLEGYLYQGKFYTDAQHTVEIVATSGKIYVDMTNGALKTYRWSGSAFVVISETIALGTTSSTAFYGDRGLQAEEDIVDLQEDVTKIKNGNITVGKATDAEKLGGVEANKYALKDDVPDEELFVVEGTQVTVGTASVTLQKTYAEIVAAINNKKIPILHLHDPDYDTDYAYQYASYQTDDIEVLRFICVEGTTYSSVSIYNDGRTSYSSNTLIERVSDTAAGTAAGTIVSKIEKSGSIVNVTRRAMTVTDLPTPVYDEKTDATYSLVSVNSKGQVTGGNQLIEWGAEGQETPSADLAIGGLFFKKV